MTQTLQRQQALLDWINSDTPYRSQSIQMVSGDASFRRYFRFTDAATQQSVIAVDAPPEFEDSQRFVAIARAYQQAGVNVPRVLAHSAVLGFYLLSDFGDRQFASELATPNLQPLYLRAIAQLPAIQSCVAVNGQALPAYDDQLLQAELHLFQHWLVEVHLGISLSAAERALITASYAFLLETFKAQPQVGVHRDFHSRNLMLLEQDDVGVIDFQDAVVGPLTYDLVSLLRDCYQDWPEPQIIDILEHCHQRYYAQYPWAEFQRWFDLVGVQRHIKASGIFCRLCHRDGKSGYLQDIPHTLNYIVKVAANYPQLTEFGHWVKSTILPKMHESLA